MGDSERRRHPRLGRYYGVKYRPLGNSPEGQGAEHVGLVINLSAGGAILVSKISLTIGSGIEMEFPEAILAGKRTLRGRIAWVRQEESGDRQVGVEFHIEEEPEGASREGPVCDRRRYPRLGQRLPLNVRCVTPGPFHESETRGAEMRDFSEGGVEMVTTREYVPRLVIEMRLPASPLGPSRTCYARVLHWKGADEPGRFALGCAFIRPGNAQG